MKNKVITIILVLIILGLCGFIVYDKFYNKPVETQKETKIEEETGNLTKEELYDIQEFLSRAGAKDFLKVYFSKTTEIDMNKVLMYNPLHSYNPIKEDRKYYCEIMKLDTCNDEVSFEGDVQLYEKESVANYYKNYTGEDISSLNETFMPKYYSESDNAYFTTHSDAYESTIYVLDGTKNDKNMYYIEYLGTAYVDDEEKSKPVLRKVVLKKSGSSLYGYYFISNKKLK